MPQEQKIVGLQVLPFFEAEGEIVPCPEGPDRDRGLDFYDWAVYQRLENGEAKWLADFSERIVAFTFANSYAKSLAVKVEQYGWMTDSDRFDDFEPWRR